MARTILASLMMLSVAAVAEAQRCVVDLVVQNKNRLVDGDVSAECGGDFHSPPFGNWGVALAFHPAGKFRDGYQFSGWKADDGWLQWNSCTTEPEFAPGNELYYNDDMHRSQRAWPDVINVSHSVKGFYGGRDGNDCMELTTPKRVIFENVNLKVYELDPRTPFPPSGELVAELSYETVRVPYTCEGPWECSGESEWIEPVSGHDTVYADIRLAVRLRKDHDR